MSNFNKVVTNIPVSLTETEMSNLSQTFSGIIQGGGGGGEGKRYIGDGVYVTVNNDANPGVISLTQTSLDKLNKEIPSAVSSFPDSIQYAKKTYVDNTFQTKDAMSAYATTAYVSGVTASIYYTNILGLVDALNAKQDILTFGYDETDAISSINSHKLAGEGGVTGDYYSASNPSGFINSTQAETQILEKHYLTEASGNSLYVPIPNGLSDGQYYAMTTSSWKVIQGAGDVSGISTVAHDDTLTGNGNNENLGVDTTKIQIKLTDAEIQNIADVSTLKTASSTWDNVSAKLNTTDFNTYTATTAPSTYQPIGNYLSSNALDGYATQQWVEQQGYIKQETDWTNTIQEASAKAYNDATANANSLYQAKGDYVKNTDISLDANNKITAISGKELIITAHQSLTDYYTKSQTSGANELSTEFGKYALKSEIPTVPTKVSDLTDSANYYKTTETSGAAEISTALDKKVDKPDTTQVELNNKYLIYSTLSAEGQPKGWVDMQTKVYSKTEADGTFQKKNDMGGYLTTEQYATDSATFYPTSNPDGYLTKTVADTYYQPTGYYATSAGLTAGNQYAMTTTGWEVVQGGTSFTGVVIDTGLSGTGLSNSPLGIDTTASIYFTNGSAKSALSADKAASASAAKRLQDSTSGPVIQVGDVTALQNWASSNSSTWDNVSAKSTVSANTTTNVISISANSTATTANLSATTYYTNTADSTLVAQRLFVVHNDDDLVAHVTAGLCQGQGSLFFVMSGFNS